MRTSVLVSLVTLAFFAVSFVDARKAQTEEMFQYLEKHASFKVKRYPEFMNMELEDFKKRLGTRIPSRPNQAQDALSAYQTFKNQAKEQKEQPADFRTRTSVGAIPDSFDARKQWPKCIHPIINQEQCGSCWAFGATEALSDRFCIYSNGQVLPANDTYLSPQTLVSCDYSNDGCNGGQLGSAWAYMQDHGVTTINCMPYTSGGGNSGQCPNGHCTAQGQQWKLYKAKTHYAVVDFFTWPWERVKKIQEELMAHGPVEMAFTVYEDFMHYSKGVYKHTYGQELGGHAVKYVGWGVDAGTPYWIVANSWGASWGLDGFFWILRGHDECGCEKDVWAGAPDV